jgi:hypothetical protein
MKEEDRIILDDLSAEWTSIVDDGALGGQMDRPPEASPDAPRGPGRPGWTHDSFLEHWREAVAATKPPLTLANIAANFKLLNDAPCADERHLRKLYKKHGPPKPG